MKRLIAIVVITIWMTTSVAFAQKSRPRATLNNAAVSRLEQTIPHLMTEADIPGLSIAVIRDSKVMWTRGFGVTNSETKARVNDNTVFEAASLTKPVFAYAALKLIDNGKLDLDTPLVKYLPGRYDVGDDPRLDQITARHVLSHTTGFPNWRPRGDKTLKMYFSPGLRFSYSGEGFVYLSKVVEQITGESQHAFIKRTVFDPLDMKSSELVWRNEYESLKTFTHDWVGGVSGRGKPEKPNAAASLHTTANDYAKFVIAMLKGTGLKPATARLMLTPQASVTLAGAFNLNAPDAKLSPTVSWGLGWGLEQTQDGTAFWHWGDNGDTKAFVLAVPKQKTGLVMFANSANGLSIINELVESVMGNDHPSLAWLNLERYNSQPRLMLKAILKSDAETVLTDYRGHRAQAENKLSLTENEMNRLGYQLLRLKRIKDAIAVFTQNTVDFPQAFNTWDSLAEGYMIDGDKESAIKYYKKSLELNPDNTNAAQKLKELGAGN
ncbi:MAG TPA: serine hydrolase [Pyrinomonadaceae bacterium]|nr:serine hydrolase [Pyrinomonadaceae bacterium]